MNRQELQHFGVPGMKWGVRKSPDRVEKRQTKNISKSIETVKKIKSVTEKPKYNYRKANRLFSKLDKLDKKGMKDNAKYGKAVTDEILKRYGNKDLVGWYKASSYRFG